MINKNVFWGVIVITFFVLLLITQQCSHNKEITDFKTTQKALEDTIKVTRNKLGQSVGTTSVIETDKTKDFLALASKDSTIQKLQKLVKTYKGKLKGQGVAAIINAEANINVVVPTVVDSTDKTAPIYIAEYKLRDSLDEKKVWAYGKTISKKDSTNITLKYREELEVLIGEESTGFLGLGKSKPFAQVTFLNPYSEVKEMKVYQKAKPNTKYWHIGPGAFYGISSELKPQFFVGAGIMWTPIKF